MPLQRRRGYDRRLVARLRRQGQGARAVHRRTRGDRRRLTSGTRLAARPPRSARHGLPGKPPERRELHAPLLEPPCPRDPAVHEERVHRVRGLDAEDARPELLREDSGSARVDEQRGVPHGRKRSAAGVSGSGNDKRGRSTSSLPCSSLKRRRSRRSRARLVVVTSGSPSRRISAAVQGRSSGGSGGRGARAPLAPSRSPSRPSPPRARRVGSPALPRSRRRCADEVDERPRERPALPDHLFELLAPPCPAAERSAQLSAFAAISLKLASRPCGATTTARCPLRTPTTKGQ